VCWWKSKFKSIPTKVSKAVFHREMSIKYMYKYQNHFSLYLFHLPAFVSFLLSGGMATIEFHANLVCSLFASLFSDLGVENRSEPSFDRPPAAKRAKIHII